MNEYKRLTKRRGNGVCYSTKKYEITCYPMNNNLSEVDKIAVRLCELEDKIENGTLVDVNVDLVVRHILTDTKNGR